MPRSSVLLTPELITGADIVDAVSTTWQGLQLIDDSLDEFDVRELANGFGAQVIAAGVVIATFTQSRELRASEALRLLPDTSIDATARAWAEVHTPWQDIGVWGLVIIELVAQNVGGLAVHRGTIPTIPTLRSAGSGS